MPFRRSIVAFFALSLLLTAPAPAGQVIDRILVWVNGRVITQSQLDNRVEQTLRDAGSVPLSQRDEVRKGALTELLNEALLEDRARDLDLVTTDQDVEDQIKRLKEQNQVTTDEDFDRALAASGLNMDRLREQIRRTLTVQRVVGREVNSKVDLSDDALRVIYEREKETWVIKEHARVSEVYIAGGEDEEGRAASERRAKEASEKLKGGAKFDAIVKEYSEGSTRERGGDMGAVARGELNPELDRVLFSLPPNGVSEPVRTRSGWHILKLVEKTPVSYKPFSEVKADLLKREQETQFQKKLAEYLDKLRKEAVIKVAAEAQPYYAATPAEAAKG